MAKNEQPKKNYNYQDQRIIQEFVQSRLEQGEQLEFESFEEYEIPPPAQFAMLARPTISIKGKEFTFSTSAIRLFEGIKFVRPMVSSTKKRLCIVPLSAEEEGSIVWARQRKDGKWVNKTITSLEFVQNFYNLMNWNRECRYRIVGKIVNSPEGLALLFNLKEATMQSKEKVEYIDPETGEVKKTHIIYYPDHYKGRIGKSYSDYMASRDQSFYEQFGELTNNTYGEELMES